MPVFRVPGVAMSAEEQRDDGETVPPEGRDGESDVPGASTAGSTGPDIEDRARQATIAGVDISRWSLRWTVAGVLVAVAAAVVAVLQLTAADPGPAGADSGNVATVEGGSDRADVSIDGQDNEARVSGSDDATIRIGGGSGNAAVVESDDGTAVVGGLGGVVLRELASCPTGREENCDWIIRDAAQAVWPPLEVSPDCSVQEPAFGIERFYLSCPSGDLKYFVFWRPAGSRGTPIANRLASILDSASIKDFRIAERPDTLGLVVAGTSEIDGRTIQTCLWEYSDFPVAMALEGPAGPATQQACDSRTFLVEEDMASQLGPP